ncbi:MAG: alanine:cation symporter family protein [Lentisphaeria bacterium]|nr:alanine:cation symporter family protein [Lentisphaeria bacterium]
MNGILNSFAQGLKSADAFLWGPPLLILLLGVHLFYTVRLLFVQRYLGSAFRLIMQKDDTLDGNVSPMAALAVALASTIGTGNVVGVATAIVLGGPGAVFWCMITGVFGMATKYAESLLAVKYRIRDKETGEVHGGPMYTILRGLKWKPMAMLFCFFGFFAVLGTGNLVQSNAIASVINRTFEVPPWITGLVIAILTGLVIVGGLSSIANVCTCLVPLMSFIYLAGCITLLILNFSYLPETVVLIVKSAFTPQAALGGAAAQGFMLAARYGIARGLFSNEAGMGSEPIVAATARTRNAVRQGLVSYTGTFCTIIICAMTGLVIVSCALAYPDKVNLSDNAILTQVCFEQIPAVGKYILSFAIFAFAITTLLGWFYYGQECILFLFKSRKVTVIYKIFYVFMAFVGAVSSLSLAWDFANFANGLMVIPNVVSLILLQKVVVAETKKYLWSKRLDDNDPRCIRGNPETPAE